MRPLPPPDRTFASPKSAPDAEVSRCVVATEPRAELSRRGFLAGTAAAVCLAGWPGASAAAEAEWISMFDGKTLGRWKSTNFGGEAEVAIEDGAIVLPIGTDMTGVTWSAEFPKLDYELELEAQRTEGIDFFCGLTFPVNDAFLSFIVGGWSGTVVGFSSLDDRDASDNDTTTRMDFKDKRWYKLRIRIAAARLQAWIDDKSVVDVDPRGKKLSVRGEVEPSKPLGICTWRTEGRLKNLRYRSIKA